MQSVDRPVHRPSQPIMPAGAAPKLTIEKFADGGVACIRFVGTIDEGFEGRKLGLTAGADTLVLDLGGVKKISSFGIREWIDFVTTAHKACRAMILIECAPKVIDQLNMVANFAGGGRVFSFYAPFRCDYCEAEHRVLLQIDRDHELIKAMKPAERPCLSCKESMYFDEDGASYFSYVLGQERFGLEPATEAFLAAKLNYAVSDLNRKLRVDKVIEGRTTYLRLHGDLDGGFPRDKLAEGVEGTLIVDLGAIGKIEPAGAMAWRGFVGLVAPAVDRVFLAAAPPAFVEKLCTRDDLNPKVQLVTLLMPYTCASCGTTGAHHVDVAAHYDALKLATAPELRCPQCKHAMQCHAGDAMMALLPTMPKPTAGPDLVKSVAVLRARALAVTGPRRAAAAGSPAAARPTLAGARAGLLVPTLAALLAVVVAAAAYLAYQRVTAGAAPTGAAAITRRSAVARPAWLTSDAPAGALCSEAPGQAIACLGVSSLSARLDDAEEEAGDAALDAVAAALAVRITDSTWRRAVVPVYAAARDAKLAAFDRDPASTTARRDVRAARHAVAQALRATSGGAVPPAPTGRYWEEQPSADGKRYLAFAQVTLGASELARLVETYTARSTALGASAVTAFPLLGWRYPRLDAGAMIISLTAGPIQRLGVAEQYVVLGVGGRDVRDGAGFARLAADEHAGLIVHGGPLRLKVQAGDGAPRELSTEIKPRLDTATPAVTGKPRPGPTGAGVNVWDKFGGDPGSGRDDPTQ
jgi:DNA-directed RNA polymerase subunit RPC12/RpoP/anti-anti-sigma regulatory factor